MAGVKKRKGRSKVVVVDGSHHRSRISGRDNMTFAGGWSGRRQRFPGFASGYANSNIGYNQNAIPQFMSLQHQIGQMFTGVLQGTTKMEKKMDVALDEVKSLKTRLDMARDDKSNARQLENYWKNTVGTDAQTGEGWNTYVPLSAINQRYNKGEVELVGGFYDAKRRVRSDGSHKPRVRMTEPMDTNIPEQQPGPFRQFVSLAQPVINSTWEPRDPRRSGGDALRLFNGATLHKLGQPKEQQFQADLVSQGGLEAFPKLDINTSIVQPEAEPQPAISATIGAKPKIDVLPSDVLSELKKTLEIRNKSGKSMMGNLGPNSMKTVNASSGKGKKGKSVIDAETENITVDSGASTSGSVPPTIVVDGADSGLATVNVGSGLPSSVTAPVQGAVSGNQVDTRQRAMPVGVDTSPQTMTGALIEMSTIPIMGSSSASSVASIRSRSRSPPLPGVTTRAFPPVSDTEFEVPSSRSSVVSSGPEDITSSVAELASHHSLSSISGVDEPPLDNAAFTEDEPVIVPNVGDIQQLSPLDYVGPEMGEYRGRTSYQEQEIPRTGNGMTYRQRGELTYAAYRHRKGRK